MRAVRLAILVITGAFLSPGLFAGTVDLTKAKQHCQCPQCDFHGLNLSEFTPGSEHKDENPFAESERMCTLSCNFSGANFSEANLTQTNFRSCYSGYMPPLKLVDFHQASFVRALFTHSILAHGNFSGANFTAADLSYSTLQVGNFSSANFHAAKLIQAKARPQPMIGIGANFKRANFTAADLSGADLHGNFDGADFSQAKLKGARLASSDEDLTPGATAPFVNTNFTNTRLQGAELSFNGKPAALSQATLCHTVLPSGKLSNRDCAQSR